MGEKKFDGNLQPGPVSIGIDQSLTGFAVTALNVDDFTYQSWVYKSDKRGVARLADIRAWFETKLDWITKSHHVVIDIAMEAAIMASPTSLMLGELAGLVKLTLWDYFDVHKYSIIPFATHLRTPLLIPPTTLKKFAAGKGNAKKQEMLMQIYKRYGVEFNDDNAADSYALARLASGKSLGAIEAQVLDQINDPKYRDNLR